MAKPASKTTPKSRAKPEVAKRAQRRALAVRLSEEDWAFVSAQNADNPSEGLRAVLAQARASAAPVATIAEAQARLMTVIQGSLDGLRTPPRSIVSEDILREAALVVATAMAGPPQPGFSDGSARLAFEAQIVDRGFDLLDALLRHALTPNAAAWNPDAVRCRLSASKDLLVSALSAVARDNPVASNGGKP